MKNRARAQTCQSRGSPADCAQAGNKIDLQGIPCSKHTWKTRGHVAGTRRCGQAAQACQPSRPVQHSTVFSTPAPRATAPAACPVFKNSLGGASSGVSLPGGRTGNCMYSCRLTCTLPTGIASSRLSLPSHTVMTRSVCRFERRTGNTNALPFPFDGQDGLALLYTIPVTACAGGGRGMAAREAGR
jgi:hypothetical protein